MNYLQYIKELVWPSCATQGQIMAQAALLGGIVSMALGDMGNSVYAFIALAIIDYVTGIIAAIKAKNLASGTGFKGLGKKFAMLGVIFLAWLIDKGMQMSVLCNMAIMAYSANEGISILENIDRCGWGHVIPPFIKDKIKSISDGKIQKTERVKTNENIHQPRPRP